MYDNIVLSVLALYILKLHYSYVIFEAILVLFGIVAYLGIFNSLSFYSGFFSLYAFYLNSKLFDKNIRTHNINIHKYIQ